MADTSIEWATKVWNPTTGCDRVSPGCDHCYALTMAGRLKLMGQAKYQADGDPRTSGPGFALTVHPDTLGIPATWPNPERVFVNSMSDLFHQDVLGALHDDRPFLAHVMARMAALDRHVFQILTKRPQLMVPVLRHPRFRLDVNGLLLELAHPVLPGGFGDPWPRHLWFGVSIESDRYCFRADHLRRSSAGTRFLSLEPLLDPLPSLELAGIDWVIIGGESGHGARRMDFAWALDLVHRCQADGVPVFVKQLGTVLARELGVSGKGDDLEDLPAEIRVREFPTMQAAA